MRKVKLLKEILEFIKDVKVCDKGNSFIGPYDDPDCPLCLIGNAIRSGIKVPKKTAYGHAFARFFGVTSYEALELLYPKGEYRLCSGEDYYKLGQEMLLRNGRL